MQAKISLVNTQVKGEMVLTDFDLATGYVQRKQNIRKREIYMNTFSHILARGGYGGLAMVGYETGE